jgi:pimeloyl-ACP methyl ester carboxylesterase
MSEKVRFEERTFLVQADGRNLRVMTVLPSGGQAAGEATLVFLHEGLGSIGQWRDFPRRLAGATGLGAIIYDRQGFGGSDPLDRGDEQYLQREDLTSLSAVLDACSVQAPVLIGHSDGGTIALLYAAQVPERPRGVITLAAHVFVEEATLAGIRNAVQAFETGELKQKLSRYHAENTDSMFCGFKDDWLLPRYREWNIEACLQNIRCPLLVIQGEDDEYGTAAQVEAITVGVSGPVESMLIPGCGHNPHLQAGERVLSEMKRFIGRSI